MIKEIIKLIVTIIFVVYLYFMPQNLIYNIEAAGYFGELFVAIFLGKLATKTIGAIIFLWAINKFIDKFTLNL